MIFTNPTLRSFSGQAQDGMEPLTIAILGGLAATVGGTALISLARSSPAVMRLLRRRLAGADLLILGKSGAGKTSFWNFLRYRIFADAYPPMTTVRPEKIGAFTVEREDDKNLDIKPTEDFPGDWEPEELMEVLVRQRPDLIAVLCPACDEQALPWFRAFCSRLNLLLLDNMKIGTKLKAIVVVQSKMDLASPEELRANEEALRGILVTELTAALQHRAAEVPITQCTFYKSSGGEPRANELVLLMTRLLSSRGPLAVTFNG